MEIDDPEMKRYLTELCARTKGDTGAQVSMSEVGAALGLEKTAAGILAEELIIQGFAELKSLSGGIGITAQGVETVRGPAVEQASTVDNALRLGDGPVLAQSGRQALEKVLAEIRTACVQRNAAYGQLEEIVFDIKTIEVQMLSPRPKTAIIREVLRSLHNNLSGQDGVAAAIDALTRA